jgi:hypothetical protein
MCKPKQQYSDTTFSNPSQSTQTFAARNKGKKVIRDDKFDAM